MAHNAKTSALTDELVRSILQFDPATNRQAYRHAKDIAARGLRTHQYARTNQFDVSRSFAGLDEKFRVKNRDDLADALQLRLKKLDAITHKFKPEFLSLLLHLADRPLENTELRALELLRVPSPPPPLTWREILDSDPYSDDEIWKDIDYAGDSSGDDKPAKKRPVLSSSPATSVEAQDDPTPEASIVPSNVDVVAELKASQFWAHVTDEEKPCIDITELQAVRETLFMLSGMPTSLYQLDKERNLIHNNTRYALRTSSAQAIEHLLSQFATIGQQVYRLRQWTKVSSSVSLVQTFEAAVQQRLLAYDQSLARLQEHYFSPAAPVTVSLIKLHTDVRSMSAPLLRLAHIVASVEPNILQDPFSPLEALFDEIVLAQMTLETNVFQYMSSIFFECLQTYLRPIRAWMEAGELRANDDTFFVFENNAETDLGSIWHERYALRRDAQGKLRVPSFLQPAVTKIFNTGKSILFLEELGVRTTFIKRLRQEPRLNYDSVCGSSDTVPLEPFPELFEVAFEAWMQSKHSHASSVLRQHLFDSSSLLHVLDRFELLYLGKNGAVFETFASAFFERMDAGKSGWRDRYALTEIARDVFGTCMTRLEAERVVVRSHKVNPDESSNKTLGAISFDYAISWPIQNIISRASVSIYQQLFTFLLLAYRVKYLLQRARHGRSGHSKKPQLLDLFHRITWFTDILRSYLTETAIFFTTRDMTTAISAGEDIDEMAQVHANYMQKLEERALLSKNLKLIKQNIDEILDLGVQLALTATCERHGQDMDESDRTSKIKRSQNDVASDDSEVDTQEGQDYAPIDRTSRAPSLQKIDTEFKRHLAFVTAGLRSIGRAGGEPMWEQLAQRLSWEEKTEPM